MKKTRMRSLVIVIGILCAAATWAQTATTTAPTAKASVAAPAKIATAGGAGKVWVNSSSKTYHCEGSKFYGKTKSGEYMSEAEAKAKGNHPVKGQACAK
ncbi:hypothetical protein [Rhodoferax sp. GW822-FHT02A01]|uniref:hypothetical protein n=1 Tax=Rhodoferax sp. GW822-FHT02A01 TaxID=3141537 RepID=UPI00315D09DF